MARRYASLFGVYQDFYTREYITNQSSSAISWIRSVNTFLLVSVDPAAGRLHDRGHFYFLVYGGLSLVSFFLFMLSLAQPNHFYQVLLSQGLGVGIGSSMLSAPRTIISQYFVKRRALAMAIAASGTSLGAVIYPLMQNNMLGGRLGFGNAARAFNCLPSHAHETSPSEAENRSEKSTHKVLS